MAGLENFTNIWSVAPETVAIESGKTLAFPTSADTGPGGCLYHAFGERMKSRPKLASGNIFAMPATAHGCELGLTNSGGRASALTRVQGLGYRH
jgi:hypothetical protein